MVWFLWTIWRKIIGLLYTFKNIKGMSTIEKTKEEIAIEELLTSNKELILFNDDVNTFDHVIDTLIRICNHDLIQAEQCAMLVHYKGKCSVKTGSYEELEPMCTGLLDAGLSAEIQ